MNQIQAPRSGGGGQKPAAVLPRGSRLGSFTIDGVFGRGASGVTYLAHDADGGAVALKALDTDASPDAAAAFRREAEILGLLQHPSIVALQHFEPHGDPPFMALAQLGGRSLSDLLAAKETVDLRALLFGLLDALDHLHGAGYLHRDIKPSNVVLSAAGDPVLIDFGAAEPIDAAVRPAHSRATPGYAALEQCVEDGSEGPWTDLYGIGAIAYRLATGAPPPAALDRADGTDMAPAVEAGRGRYPEPVLAAIDWALDQAVHRRPQTVEDWRRALAKAWSAPDAKGQSIDGNPNPAPTAAVDDYAPTEEITRVTPPPRKTPRRVALDLPVAPGPARAPQPRPTRGNGQAWFALALGIVMWAGIGIGGYVYGWPYYLRNIKSEWLVDAAGGGDVRTISEALETAREGALVQVRPGTYPESLAITRPVTLIGLEPDADGTPSVVVAPESGGCLNAAGTPVVVSGFSFQQGATTDGAATACIVLGAEIAFQGNHVTASGGPSMHVGAGANPVVSGNRLTATTAPALLIDNGALGQFRENVITSAERPGIVVSASAPMIEANTIEATGLAGIVYDAAAAGRFAGNTIRQAGASGIEIRGKSNPVISGNRVEASRQAGIFVFDDGRGRLDGNTITGNAFSGVVIGAGARPALTGNTISENVEHGILALTGAAGKLQSNSLESNGGFGIALEKEVEVQMEANQLSGNREPQVRVDGVVRPFPDESEIELLGTDADAEPAPGSEGGAE